MSFTYYCLFLLLAWLFSWVVYFGTFVGWCDIATCEPFDGIADTYDYIVVGAGSAGSVVAYRLASQDKNNRVLLLEAGTHGNRLLDIPAVSPLLQKSDVDWQYKTETQMTAFYNVKNRQAPWPRGKIVGGSGRLNNMLYVRGHQSDYKNWFPNDTKVDYREEILFYFKKSEHQLGRFKDHPDHGSGGPLVVEDAPYVTELASKMLETAKLYKIPLDKERHGFRIPQTNTWNGKRYSTSHFLEDNWPANLTILTHAMVSKINFAQNFEAKSVEVIRLGFDKKINAKMGIVICAGAVETPKLLQLSGIGPSSLLKNFRIKLVKEIKEVGQNLQDHVGYGLDLYRLKTFLDINPFSLTQVLSFFKYLFFGTGPLATVQCEAMFFLHSDCIKDLKTYTKCSREQAKDKAPDLQVMILPLGVASDYGAFLYKLLGLRPIVMDFFYEFLFGKQTISIVPVLLHPKSRGYVQIRTDDPHDHPVIQPNYLSDYNDVSKLVYSMRVVKQLMESKPMQEFGPKLIDFILPGCEQPVFNTPLYWTCYLRHMTLTIYHPVGTAALGSVLDYDFRVRGLNKIWVADASAIPTLPSGNPQAAVVMAAEMASDFIKRSAFLDKKKSSKKMFLRFYLSKCF